MLCVRVYAAVLVRVVLASVVCMSVVCMSVVCMSVVRVRGWAENGLCVRVVVVMRMCLFVGVVHLT